MHTAKTILALIGILCALGSLAAQLIYLRASHHGLHATASAALAAAAVLCTLSVTITLTITLP